MIGKAVLPSAEGHRHRVLKLPDDSHFTKTANSQMKRGSRLNMALTTANLESEKHGKYELNNKSHLKSTKDVQPAVLNDLTKP